MSVLDIEGRPLAGDWIPGVTGRHAAGAMLGWESLQKAERRTTGPLGVVVDSSICSDALAPWLGDLDLVVIMFSAPCDEKALLLASVLRECHAYKGEICASGPITPAEHSVLKACGFSMLAPDENASVAAWRHTPA